MKVFGGGKLTDEEKKLLDYYIFSGTYGTTENSVNNRVKEYGSGASAKLRYALGRLFVPLSPRNPRYAVYSSFYSWYYEKKYRLVLLFFRRLWLAGTRSRARSVREIRALVMRKR